MLQHRGTTSPTRQTCVANNIPCLVLKVHQGLPNVCKKKVYWGQVSTSSRNSSMLGPQLLGMFHACSHNTGSPGRIYAAGSDDDHLSGDKSGREITLREPPKSKQATAFLMSAWPKMFGAILLKICSCRLGWAANALKAASSCILHGSMSGVHTSNHFREMQLDQAC